MESRMVRVEVKIETIEKTLEKATRILEELVKAEIHQMETQARVKNIEANLSRLNWMVITAVIGAILTLVIKG